jgi:uncharacterized protein
VRRYSPFDPPTAGGEILSMKIDQKALAEICDRHGITRLRLFGSLVRDEGDETSDVDLLAEFTGRKSLLDLVRVERELSEHFGRRVDLLTENALSPYLRGKRPLFPGGRLVGGCLSVQSEEPEPEGWGRMGRVSRGSLPEGSAEVVTGRYDSPLPPACAVLHRSRPPGWDGPAEVPGEVEVEGYRGGDQGGGLAACHGSGSSSSRRSWSQPSARRWRTLVR